MHIYKHDIFLLIALEHNMILHTGKIPKTHFNL